MFWSKKLQGFKFADPNSIIRLFQALHKQHRLFFSTCFQICFKTCDKTVEQPTICNLYAHGSGCLMGCLRCHMGWNAKTVCTPNCLNMNSKKNLKEKKSHMRPNSDMNIWQSHQTSFRTCCVWLSPMAIKKLGCYIFQFKTKLKTYAGVFFFFAEVHPDCKLIFTSESRSIWLETHPN